MSYVPGLVPADAEPWLVRELNAISQAARQSVPAVFLQPLAVEPSKPREGQVVYSTGLWTGGVKGYYGFKGTTWVLLG